MFELERHEAADPRLTHASLVGELDLTNAEELERRLSQLTREDGGALALDLSRVVFIDSAALHVLFRVASRLGRDRFGLAYAASAPIARTLEIVGLPKAAVTGESIDAVLDELARS